jgi:hypothetical protein
MHEEAAILDPAQIHADQEFARAVPAGIGAAIVGALLWAAFGYFSGMSLGLVAILIGVVVGYAIRRVGKGVDRKFGYLGGACAAFGWALGTWLCDLALLAKDADRPILAVLNTVGIGQSLAFAVRASGAMDLLFLAIAVWEGYRFSLRYRKTG